MLVQDIIEISKEAVWLILKIGGPVLLLSLVIGFVISLLQALTQMQEMTLSFVPKIVIIFISFILLMPYMFSQLQIFTLKLFDQITVS